mgnify:CR=1 FL=1
MYQLLSNGMDNMCNHSLRRYVETNLETQIFGARSLIDPFESGMWVPRRMRFMRKPYCTGFDDRIFLTSLMTSVRRLCLQCCIFISKGIVYYDFVSLQDHIVLGFTCSTLCINFKSTTLKQWGPWNSVLPFSDKNL